MKTVAPNQPRQKDIIEKISDAVLIRVPIRRLGDWLDYRLFKNDVYELLGDELVAHRQQRSLFKVHEVSTWQQAFICFGVPLIIIKLADGRELQLSDKHEDMLRILQSAIPNKELPWTAI